MKNALAALALAAVFSLAACKHEEAKPDEPAPTTTTDTGAMNTPPANNQPPPANQPPPPANTGGGSAGNSAPPPPTHHVTCKAGEHVCMTAGHETCSSLPCK